MKARHTSKAVTLAFGLTAVLLIWWCLYLLLDNPSVPSPWLTLGNTFAIFPLLMHHLGYSIVRIMVALVLSAGIGSIIGILMASYPKLDRLLSPIVYVLMPLPKIALLPVFMIVFGLGEIPKILVMVSVMVFQFIVAVRDGVKEIPQALKLSVTSLDLNAYQVLCHLTFPAILPKWFTSLRISFGISIAVLFFAETFASTYGMGYFIMNRWGVVNYPDMFSGIVVLSVFGLLVYEGLDLLEARFCKWMHV